MSYILDGLAVHGKEDIGYAHGLRGRRVAERVAQVHDFEHRMRTQDVDLEPDAKHTMAPDSALLDERMHRHIVLPQQRASGAPQSRPRVFARLQSCEPRRWRWHDCRRHCSKKPQVVLPAGDREGDVTGQAVRRSLKMSFSPQTPLAGEPVIIDTDPGIDDALALVLAAASSMRIEGVTIVHGNGKDVQQLGTVDVRARLRERERTVRMIPTTIKARGGGRNHRGLARGDGLNHRGLAFVDFDPRHALEH